MLLAGSGQKQFVQHRKDLHHNCPAKVWRSIILVDIDSADDGLDEAAVHSLQQHYPPDVIVGLKRALHTSLHDQRSAFESFLVPFGFLAIMATSLRMQQIPAGLEDVLRVCNTRHKQPRKPLAALHGKLFQLYKQLSVIACSQQSCSALSGSPAIPLKVCSPSYHHVGLHEEPF